ncbi:hypothetical protein [uncultured Shewanella sp.]|uniref:hypothetical protein n=1 Tax=uncultured Shewanella sp. TaxID=173975 RepID=UPI002612231F|nr:hypothetical protein [uncultured Shewanella sp.]
MKLMKKNILIVLFIVISFHCQSMPQLVITNYQQIFIPGFTIKGELRIAIRQFDNNGHLYYLIVNPYNFVTSIVKVGSLYSRNPVSDTSSHPGYFQWEVIKETPYVKALWSFTKYHQLENDGLTHAEHSVQHSLFLTVDMCPSIKPFESKFFQALVKKGKLIQGGFPVAISISGLWILGHEQEFQWLLKMQSQHLLNITWVNHSFSHLYFADLPNKNNFLLFSQTNLDSEILTSERLLIEAHQTPSVFIRFPGLVANKNLMRKVRHYGLIPLGADAWLAKNEDPINGSLILVHGNGNEHEGIEKVMPILQEDWHWLPIDRAFLNGKSN